MWDRIKMWFAPPVIEGDEETQRVATLLNVVLWAEFGLVMSAIPLLFLTAAGIVGLLAIFALAGLVIAMRFILKSGRVRLAGSFFLWSLWVFATAIILMSGGIAHQAPGSYFVVILVAGLILGSESVIATAVLSGIVCIALVVADQLGIVIPAPIAASFLFDASMLISNLVMVATIFYLAIRGLRQALARARQNALDLEAQSAQLETLVEARTQELARRTAYLGATTAVSQEAASVQGDAQSLLGRVVAVISEQFGYYHTGLFMLDEQGEWAVLRAASSAGGQRMLARGHRLQVSTGSAGQGVVGYVAGYGQVRVAHDVGTDAVFFDNPDLPETHSEAAVPLRVRGEVIGVLDVQSTEPEAFSNEDVTVLQSLADQVAVAINNAQLFQQVQDSLVMERRAYAERVREAWQDLLRVQRGIGFVGSRQDVLPAAGDWEPQMRAAVRVGEIVPAGPDAETAGSLSIPIEVRGEVIGVIDGRKPDGGEWTETEIELLQALTAQLSVALEGAQLYQETQRRASREQLTREISDRMRATLGWNELMQVAVEEMAGALDASRAFVQWMPSERGGTVEQDRGLV